ncbi:MAG: PrsW family intramembrane metalloprotease [Oscillospiraceae bacterium]|nr:PrsW family intramembrane metalloprotease [Oscillospiraceae bacterium]
MFYFLLSSLLSYDVILIAAAIIPAIFLMVKVYRSDRLEQESPSMLWVLVRAGIFSALIALVLERVFSEVLTLIVPMNHPMYTVLLYFVVVAVSEEGAKYFMLRRSSWNSAEFNCQYDGVVYAVFVSLGFALWENISYVMHYGFSTALVRAVTAIPGHTSFGVFMGVFYGIARREENAFSHDRSMLYRVLAVLIPILLHGAYDYIASTESSSWYFVAFIAVLFAVSYWLISKMSKNDQYI